MGEVKKERKLKVYEANGRDYKPVPHIRLQGDWLKEFGFEVGTRIKVECEEGRLVITQMINNGEGSNKKYAKMRK